MKRALAAALMLAGCGPQAPRAADNAGSRLEAAATAAGMIPDPVHATLAGSWALDTDRACITPGEGATSHVGILVDYGDGQGCEARGTVRRDGERLDVQLGRDPAACRVRARFDGERIVFPAEMPEGCQSLCTGRATLDSFTVERQSESQSEAETLRTPGGRSLCPD